MWNDVGIDADVVVDDGRTTVTTVRTVTMVSATMTTKYSSNNNYPEH